MGNEKIKPGGYDEAFKTLMADFFEPFAHVTTDYEIVGLPKKTDLLIVETEKPIVEHVKLFTYFKRFNIVEFKSASDPFRMKDDLFKIPIYIGGVLLKENEANYDNSTFTLVSSKKPVKLLKYYENTTKKVKNGLYLITGSGILPVDIYIVVIDEIDADYEKEIKILKEFSTGEEKEKFLTELLHAVFKGINQNFDLELWEYAVGLYFNEIEKLAEKEKIKMTLIEQNIEKWNQKLGLKEKYINQAKMEDARKMLELGYGVEDICKITGLSKKEIIKLQEEM